VLEFQLEPAAIGTSRDLYLHGIGIAIASGMDGAPRPDRVELLPAKPNPANNTVEFGIALPKADHVRLQVFDVRGRLIRQLVDGSKPAGRHVLTWDLHDGRGVAAAPGVYFVRMRTSAGSFERKLVVM
jgi:flagellar hook assembly protein FlgD